MTPVLLDRLGPWFSAAPSDSADPEFVPSSNTINRFNDGSGSFALHYFAADEVTALLEVVVFYGSYSSGYVPSPPPDENWTIFSYRIKQNFHVVDLSDPGTRSTAKTSTQERTGDWLNYYHRRTRNYARYTNIPLVQPGDSLAPTQRLAQTIYKSTQAVGFLTPSSKLPTISNLVLFHNRLPPGSIEATGISTVFV